MGVLPYALTPDAPTLVLIDTYTRSEDDTFYLGLQFDPDLGTHDEVCMEFCGTPFAEHQERESPGEESGCYYGATMENTGRWVDGGLLYCAVSRHDLVFEWQRAAARELGLPEVTLIELRVDRQTVDKLRTTLNCLFGRDGPDMPRLELTPPSESELYQLELPIP